MFERYTEKSRRVIFFARYEASQFGSPHIETEHLLLGLLREDKALANRFLHRLASVESIKKQIESRTVVREKISTNVDLPLSDDLKRVLADAAEEADRLSHKFIGTEHLLLGLLREENCFAAQLLKERGVEIDAVRGEIARSPMDPGRGFGSGASPASTVCRDLTQAAIEGQLEPVIGRVAEVDALIAVLSSRYRRSAVLVGERGVGKTAIVEALAERIARQDAPESLASKRILALDSTATGNWMRAGRRIEDVSSLMRVLGSTSADAIVFIDDLFDLLAAIAKSELPNSAAIRRHELLSNLKQCIAACTSSEYSEAVAAIPWLGTSFRPVYVRPLDEETSLAVLRARKGSLEQFHQVTYADEALKFAVHIGSASGDPLPARALELLDAAGALARLRQPPLPAEIAELKKRIAVISQRLEDAIANHEFEKARFYSEEQRKERENLRTLCEQHHFDEAAQGTVGPELLEEVLAQWSKYPYTP
jgi:ATP-dependent Clp protease ATP-binding subunit ClpC